uniref:EH domain-containing protein 1 n=1 Tax=Cacopsylla melanoneura TaxID=428564 RepID=A0A8D8UWG9_9HEMI
MFVKCFCEMKPNQALTLFNLSKHYPCKSSVHTFKSWFTGSGSTNVYANVSEGLKEVYKSKLLPLEEKYLFHEFHSPKLTDQDFDAKPLIMLIGQYSTGKTTLIKYLLEKDFPGLRIGPEPTTDRFIIIMDGKEEAIIPGNALVADPTKQFRPLSIFGNSFLNRFQCSHVNSTILKSVSFVDTPGILSGEKQRTDRGYDFTGVLEWFAERVDRIVLLFDANKLDISDEFRRAIEALKGHDDKIKIVLNKSDSVGQQELLRIYGALMWSLGKVLNTPEVSRVYVGSFWDEPLRFDANRKLFEDEERDLFQDIQTLPRNSAIRKLNDLGKRARVAKVHAYIIDGLKQNMPTMFGKKSKQEELIANLPAMFEHIRKTYNVSKGDFPDVQKMQAQLRDHNFDKFNYLETNLIDNVDRMMAEDISKIMGMIPHETIEQATVIGGNISDLGEGIEAGKGEIGWVVQKGREASDKLFESLKPPGNKASIALSKPTLVKSKLPDSVLIKIWKLADVDEDGLLDKDEFALLMYLITLKLDGAQLPSVLPEHLIPPSKKQTKSSASTSHTSAAS